MAPYPANMTDNLRTDSAAKDFPFRVRNPDAFSSPAMVRRDAPAFIM